MSVSNNPSGLEGWFVPIGHSSSSSVTLNGWTEATERLWARSAAGSLQIIFVYEHVFLQLQGWLNLKSWDMKECNKSLLFKEIVLFCVWRINTFMQNDNSHLTWSSTVHFSHHSVKETVVILDMIIGDENSVTENMYFTYLRQEENCIQCANRSINKISSFKTFSQAPKEICLCFRKKRKSREWSGAGKEKDRMLICKQ